MGRGGRRVGGAVVAAGVTLVAASCSWATDARTVAVGDTAAVVAGDVHVTDGTGPARYWFEYGPTTAYGSRTPTRIDDEYWPYGEAVQDELRDLQHGSTYHYRLCASDDGGPGTCSDDQTVTTTDGEDSVVGDGVVTPPIDPDFIRRKVSIDAHRRAGLTRATGRASEGQSSNHAPDTGDVTCLRVEGNRATIGFLARSAYRPDQEPPTPRLVFIEDNGPTGDRFGYRDVADVATCPAPTDADFPDIESYGDPFPPIVSMGDFVVHDHR